jgi:hypothetical protein
MSFLAQVGIEPNFASRLSLMVIHEPKVANFSFVNTNSTTTPMINVFGNHGPAARRCITNF